MLNIIQKFVQTVGDSGSHNLVAVGIPCVAIGLFVWLGGLGFKKIIIAIMGAIFGLWLGFFLIGKTILSALILAAISAVLTLNVEKVIIPLIAAALAGSAGFMVLMGPFVNDVENIQQLVAQTPTQYWIIIAALAGTFIIAGYYIWPVVFALCSAALGATSIFAGMTLLLTWKNAKPIDTIAQKPILYTTVFAAMVGFGTAEQLLLCKATQKKSGKKRTEKENKEDQKDQSGWRNI